MRFLEFLRTIDPPMNEGIPSPDIASKFAIDALRTGEFVSHGSSLIDFISHYEDEPWWDETKSEQEILSSPEFREGFVKWMQFRYRYSVKQLEEDVQRAGGFPVTLTRAMVVSPNMLASLQPGSALGLFWTINAVWYGVEAYGVSPENGTKIIIEAKVGENDVNWEETLRSRMDYLNGDSEGEIQLNPGRTITVIGGDIPPGQYTTKNLNEDLNEGILDVLPPGARQLATALAMMSVLSGAVQGRESNVPHPVNHPVVRKFENIADRLNAMADIVGSEKPERYGDWTMRLWDVYQQNPAEFKRMWGTNFDTFIKKARESTPQEMGAHMKKLAQSISSSGITEAHNPNVKVKYFGGNMDVYRAYLGKKKVGHAQLYNYKDEHTADNERYVWKSAVQPEYKRQGVATALYDAIAKDLESKGMKLVPSPDTQLSQKAYEFWKARDPESIKQHGKYLAEPYQKYAGQPIMASNGRPAVIWQAVVSMSGKFYFTYRYTDVPEGSTNSVGRATIDSLMDQLQG